MGLNFDTLDKILKEEFELESLSTDNGKNVRYRYFFKDKFLYNKKAQVFCEVSELKNCGVGGYIYVGHLTEYNHHPQRDYRGQFKIGSLTEQELRELTTKVTKEYK